jgi:hypothetical protein
MFETANDIDNLITLCRADITSIPNKHDTAMPYLFSIKDSILNQAPMKKSGRRKYETFGFLVASTLWKKLEFLQFFCNFTVNQTFINCSFQLVLTQVQSEIFQ